jgi:hypothetical protein
MRERRVVSAKYLLADGGTRGLAQDHLDAGRLFGLRHTQEMRRRGFETALPRDKNAARYEGEVRGGAAMPALNLIIPRFFCFPD